MTTLEACLEGAVDLHVHSAPDIDERRYDDVDLAREAARAGMGGLLLKNHWGSTVERAAIVRKLVSELDVHGGLVLSETVGGLNPAAVRHALRLGARQVWMPTKSAANHRAHHGEKGGISVLDAGGNLCAGAREIVRLIAETGCVLGTGHLGPEEVFVLAREARAAGVTTLLVTHPEWPVTFYPVELQRELAELGNVVFERCFVSTTHRCGCVPLDTIANAIAALGVSGTVLSSDLGQPDTPAPAEGLALYAERLGAWGFSPDDLRLMMATNPRRLLAPKAAPA